MAETILQNAKVYVDGYDLSGDLNAVTVTESADLKDKTVLGSSGRKFKGGLKSHEIRLGGFWNATTGLAADNSSDAVDPVLWKAVGSTHKSASTMYQDALISVVPGGTAIGTTANNKAFFSQNVAGEYTPGAEVGEMLSFGAGFQGQGPIIRGYLMHCSSALSTASTSVIKKIGVLGTKRIYLAAHIMDRSTANACLKFHVEQDVSTDFSETPSTAIIVIAGTSHNTCYTGIWATTNPIAANSTLDHSFRISITSTKAAGTPSFKAALMLGIH
jgi:hypothetical protein